MAAVTAKAASAAAPRPLNLVAELTYRCPLRCPYCSNPVNLRAFPEALSTEDWCGVLRQAAALGVLHAGLSGGEPCARPDLPEIISAADDAGLYTHLVTSALPLTARGLEALRARGLCSIQISVQAAAEENSDRIAGARSFQRKLQLARAAKKLGMPLTLNAVLHRQNINETAAIISLARELQADRLELANAQYQGWALANRAALLPSRAQLQSAAEAVREARAQNATPEILFVLPDYFRARPKPCMGGWARRHIIIAPDGRVLPCHGAAEIPPRHQLEFWNVRARSLAECWRDAPGMRRFRGTDWLPEPCRSCPEKERDFGGCRCQAAALLGDPSQPDPACALTAGHALITRAREEAAAAAAGAFEKPAFRYRQM